MDPLAGMMKALGTPNITPELKQTVIDGVVREKPPAAPSISSPRRKRGAHRPAPAPLVRCQRRPEWQGNWHTPRRVAGDVILHGHTRQAEVFLRCTRKASCSTAVPVRSRGSSPMNSAAHSAIHDITKADRDNFGGTDDGYPFLRPRRARPANHHRGRGLRRSRRGPLALP